MNQKITISVFNWGAFGQLAVVAAVLLSTGCAFYLPDRIHYTAYEDEAGNDLSAAPFNVMPVADVPATSASLPQFDDTTIIGVALSGGGSRASVFGAAALEVLAETGIAERATYLSSVSGGGFPAAYYALKKPVPCQSSNTQEPCSSESFAQFKAAMRHNFLTGMTLNQIAKPGRITSSTRRLSSLQEELDDQFVEEAVFADLPASPVLLINGARYDDGRRFVFSNVAIPEEQSNVQQFSNATLRTASFSMPGCARPAPPDFSVALALAISAGFPPLLGPATFEVPRTCAGGEPQYWHLGDGGILDNTGVETIEDFALRAETGGVKPERVVVFSVDAGRSTPAATMMELRNLQLWTTDPGRVVDIVGKRARAYRAVALEALRKNSDVEFTLIEMAYTDAVIEKWPDECGNRKGGANAINQQLENIPTSLKITDCDAALLEVAARDVVGKALTTHRDELVQLGIMFEPIEAPLTN